MRSKLTIIFGPRSIYHFLHSAGRTEQVLALQSNQRGFGNTSVVIVVRPEPPTHPHLLSPVFEPITCRDLAINVHTR